MNVGSLFSGIGGLDLGLERAGMRVLWQVECDPYARAVLARRFPSATIYSDVREVGSANLAAVDLVCGGFPCQDVSLAGLGAGLAGERSGLWSEFARVVGELRPRFVLVENVPGLLGRGLGQVLGDLAALGFDAEWECVPARIFGAPHIRDRLFVVADTKGIRVGEGWASCLRNESSLAMLARSGGAPFSAAWPVPWAEVSAELCRMGHGLPNRLDRGRCLGNAVVPQVAEWIGRQIMRHAHSARSASGRPPNPLNPKGKPGP